MILAEFNDHYGETFVGMTPLTDSPTATFFTNGGQQLTSQTLSVTGVLLSNLQEVSGGATFSSSGKAFFTVNPGGGNAFGIFSQSQGTFASGQRMPAANAVPSGNPATPRRALSASRCAARVRQANPGIERSDRFGESNVTYTLRMLQAILIFNWAGLLSLPSLI